MEIRETFSVRVDQLQPSQIYLSEARIRNIARHVNFLSRPVPVRKVNGQYCIVEGHERCYILNSIGEENVTVYLDEKSNLSDEVFAEMVKFASDAGITSITDLDDRIVPPAQFKSLWLEKKKKFLGD